MKNISTIYVVLGQLALLLTASCDRGTKGQEIECTETQTELSLVESCPSGFTASEVLGIIQGDHSYPATWVPTRSNTNLDTRVFSGATHAIWHEFAPANGQADQEGLCNIDYLAVDSTISFATDSGEFEEVISGTIRAVSLSKIFTNGEYSASENMGSYRFENADSYDTVRITFNSSTIETTHVDGTISVTATTDESQKTGEGINSDLVVW